MCAERSGAHKNSAKFEDFLGYGVKGVRTSTYRRCSNLVTLDRKLTTYSIPLNKGFEIPEECYWGKIGTLQGQPSQTVKLSMNFFGQKKVIRLNYIADCVFPIARGTFGFLF